jgi:polar amino acid transport system substrate-binding protein
LLNDQSHQQLIDQVMNVNVLPTVQAGYLHIVASDFDARPMSYCSATDRSGYEPALARLVSHQLGLEPVWHNLPMADFYTSLQTGRYDVVWFNQAITPERQQWVNFTQPYGLFDEAVLVRATSAVMAPADLAGLRVGGLADSTNIALAATWADVTTVPYPGSDQVLPEMLAALRSGEIDALIDDELVLVVAAKEDPNLRLAFTVPTRVPFAIGVAKSRPELLAALNTALAGAIADGSMAKLWAEWIPWQPFPWKSGDS